MSDLGTATRPSAAHHDDDLRFPSLSCVTTPGSHVQTRLDTERSCTWTESNIFPCTECFVASISQARGIYSGHSASRRALKPVAESHCLYGQDLKLLAVASGRFTC
jgi:hypothetical protein